MIDPKVLLSFKDQAKEILERPEKYNQEDLRNLMLKGFSVPIDLK